MDDIPWGMEEGKVMALMVLDLSAAFDAVNHSILLKVLQKQSGMEGKCLSWFDKYLRLRHCKVNIGKAYSLEHELQCSILRVAVLDQWCTWHMPALSKRSYLWTYLYMDLQMTTQSRKPFEQDHKIPMKKTTEDLQNGAKTPRPGWTSTERRMMEKQNLLCSDQENYWPNAYLTA